VAVEKKGLHKLRKTKQQGEKIRFQRGKVISQEIIPTKKGSPLHLKKSRDGEKGKKVVSGAIGQTGRWQKKKKKKEKKKKVENSQKRVGKLPEERPTMGGLLNEKEEQTNTTEIGRQWRPKKGSAGLQTLEGGVQPGYRGGGRRLTTSSFRTGINLRFAKRQWGGGSYV